MARRPITKKHHVAPDSKFGNVVIARFINHLMHDGKKSTAERVVYDAFEIISEKTRQDPLAVFDTAIRNVSPVLEVRGKRIGGANYQIAIEVRSDRRVTLAMRWLIEASRSRAGRTMAEKLASELTEAAKGEGGAMHKREEVHRMAEANRAFSHFARS